ncbi:MAG: outer membrane lipoprotein chaperone LolA [Bacteroidetes bacterium]|nr:outer membrane lipoprotein chaperone LolA [Bacteroidota bacterium]
MKTILLFSIIFITACSVAQEKELTVSWVTENLQHRYEMIDDACVQFEQHVKFGFSSAEQDVSGTLMVKKPNRYRIETENQTIVTNGTTVWMYSKNNNQVMIDKYKENGNLLSPEKFMLNLPADYNITIVGSENSPQGLLIHLKLIPKDDRSFLKYVNLTVEEQGWMLRKITILDINETETTYKVKEIKLNTNLKDKTFVFDAPERVDVVDLR